MIVLVGFMGAGKSTLGRRLADRLGRAFRDSDDVVEERLGTTIRDYFRDAGEEAFRRVEEETILDVLDVLDDPGGVLALGGGALGSAAVRAALAGHVVVHLDVPLDVLRARIGDDSARPMLAAHDVAQLYAGRAAVYAGVAHVRVDASRPLEEVVEDVLARPQLRSEDPAASASSPVSSEVAAVLVGPPGAWTREIAGAVAASLGREVRDVDDALEALAGRPAGEFFVTEGEAAYRETERRAALDCLAGGGVVALGGGAVTDEAVAAALDGLPVVFCDVGIADAAKRIGFDASPGLVLLNPRRSWIVQAERRRPRYEAVARWSVDTSGRDLDDIAAEVVRLLGGADDAGAEEGR